jgi:ribosomal protein S18 acetylase RimI-like enzyme
MEDNELALLRRIEETGNRATAQHREVVPVGPFSALLDRATDMIWLNYAVPAGPLNDARQVSDALRQLRWVFVERKRVLRFEFTGELWPELPQILEGAGLQLQASHPLMLCTPDDFRPIRVPQVRVQIVRASSDDRTLATFTTVTQEGFGMVEEPVPPSQEQIDQLRRDLEGEHVHSALAWLEGEPAGAATTIGFEEVAELAGVATLPALRRRGVAVTTSSVLVQDHFDRGGAVVWLSAGDAAAQAVYERIGFRVAGERLNYIAAEE